MFSFNLIQFHCNSKYSSSFVYNADIQTDDNPLHAQNVIIYYSITNDADNIAIIIVIFLFISLTYRWNCLNWLLTF